MARVTNAEAAARRERVATLWAQGATPTGIAATLGIDWETAKRDLLLLGKQAVAELDVPRELSRLLYASRAVEAHAWAAKQPMQALAAVKAQLAVLQVLQGIDLAQRVAELEQRLDEAQGVTPWQSVRTRAEHRAGRN